MNPPELNPGAPICALTLEGRESQAFTFLHALDDDDGRFDIPRSCCSAAVMEAFASATTPVPLPAPHKGGPPAEPQPGPVLPKIVQEVLSATEHQVVRDIVLRYSDVFEPVGQTAANLTPFVLELAKNVPLSTRVQRARRCFGEKYTFLSK
jgi:hypothetical protein